MNGGLELRIRHLCCIQRVREHWSYKHRHRRACAQWRTSVNSWRFIFIRNSNFAMIWDHFCHKFTQIRGLTHLQSTEIILCRLRLTGERDFDSRPALHRETPEHTHTRWPTGSQTHNEVSCFSTNSSDPHHTGTQPVQADMHAALLMCT